MGFALIRIWLLSCLVAGLALSFVPTAQAELDVTANTRAASLPPLEPVYGEPAFLRLPGGTMVAPENFFSLSLDRSMRYEIILPPGYRDSDQSYPVLYLLHGYGGWSHSWIELGLHQTADYLWSEGKIEPFIIVLPDGENSYYLNHADGGARWADYLAEDLVDEIDSNFRTLADARYRAIGGLSMGGDGALQLALNYPDVFSVAGAHSPTTRRTYEDAPWPLYGEEEYWQQYSPLWLIRNADRGAWPAIWIDIGENDEWIPSARALHEALEARGIAHSYRELEGAHSAAYWILNELSYLRFYAGAFGGGVNASAPMAATAAR